MAPAPPAMQMVVKKVLGYERDDKGDWAVLLDVELSARFPYRGRDRSVAEIYC
jgi:hypothetical protein